MKNLAINRPNLFIDSGLGGLTTLFQTQELLPNENFVYCADFKNAPYGNKTPTQIQRIILCNLKQFYAEFLPKSVVFACNTATATSIQKVREVFPNLIIVGAEPAIKPALRKRKKNILVLGTPTTLEHSALIKFLRMNEFSALKFYALPELATLIDKYYLNYPQYIHKYLTEKLSQFKDMFDGVVLGCTHYTIVQEEIKEILGDVTLFESNLGIAKRLKQCLSVLDMLNDKGGKVELWSTDRDEQSLLLQNYQFLSERRKKYVRFSGIRR